MISQHAYSQPQAPMSIHSLSYHRPGGKLIRIWMISNSNLMEISSWFWKSDIWLVASTRGNELKVRQLLHCGTQYILCPTTMGLRRGQYFLCTRCYGLQAVKNQKRNRSQQYCRCGVYSSQLWNLGRWFLSIGFDEHWKQVGNKARGDGNKIAQNG